MEGALWVWVKTFLMLGNCKEEPDRELMMLEKRVRSCVFKRGKSLYLQRSYDDGCAGALDSVSV